MTIRIEDYDARWPDAFEAFRSRIQEALGEQVLRVDHIGSTSVPGLGAKDVIDIQVTVGALREMIVPAMQRSGFRWCDHINEDHVPPREDPAPALWSKYLFVEPEGERRANIHVRKLGNPNQRYALLFRDYLREHPSAAGAIDIIKRELAKRHADDVDSYYAIKDPVYDLIWVAAREWADFVDWRT